MNNNKKGLSTIVATLLIILLTIVAAGIIWAVVSGVVNLGGEQVDIGSKCLQANVVATKVNNLSAESFDVTLLREGGSGDIGGVKMIFVSDTEDTSVTREYAENIDPFATVTQNVEILEGDLANPSKVSVVVYFLSESGDEQLCPNSNSFEF